MSDTTAHEKREDVMPDVSTTTKSRDGHLAEKSSDTPTPTKKSRRTSYPGLLAPINILFPPAAKPDELPFVVAARKRATRRAWKLGFRAMLVTLACFILLLEPVTLSFLGNAAFFATIVSLMLPPTFPAMLFIIVVGMLVVGQCLGWAWSCAGMAAALSVRDNAKLAAQYQQVQASAASAANPAFAFQVSIFSGAFLDWRSTVVYGFFLAIGTFFMGLIRAHRPKLILVSIFASIVMDVMLSYGPLFPSAQYTLAKTFLLPTACFAAIGCTANFLIFPVTLNSSWMTDYVDKFLIPTLQRLQLHKKMLATEPPSTSSSSTAWVDLHASFESTQEALTSGLEGLLGGVGLLELEVSFGRLGAKDLKALTEDARELLARSVGLGVVYRMVEARHLRATAFESSKSSPGHEDSPSDFKYTAHKIHPTARMSRMRAKVAAAEDAHSHTLEALLPILAEASAPLSQATEAALLGSMDFLTRVNDTRWFKRPKESTVQEEWELQKARVDELEMRLREYREEGRDALCAPFRRFFDAESGEVLPTTQGEKPFSPQSLLLVLADSDNLVLYAQTMLDFTSKLSSLESRRRKNKVWWPTGLRKIGKLLNETKGSASKLSGDNENPDRVTPIGEEEDESDTASQRTKVDQDEDEKEELEPFFSSQPEGRDPDARPPRNGRQRVLLKLYKFMQSLKSAEVVFALKYSFVSVALWVPQVVQASAYFTYSEKGLWSLIMAQTGIAVYSGDQILSTLQKLLGTAIGLVYGMLIWYIGAGNGIGNAAGVGAAFFVLMVPVMAFRLYAPPDKSQIFILGGVTVCLVVGYSWVNAHTVQVGSAGVGYTLAWRRALLVVIGSAAAFLVMFFPAPQSTRFLVRRTHATSIQELSQIYSAILSAWLNEDAHGKGHSEDTASSETSPSIFNAATEKAARARMLSLRAKLNASKLHILQSTYELTLRGDWPKEEYMRILQLELNLMGSLAQLGQALKRLGPEDRRIIARRTAFLNPALIADVTSTFFLISYALREGAPLPEATPGPLVDRLLYHDNSLRSFSNDDTEHDPYRIEGAAIGHSRLTFDRFKSQSFTSHASAVLALAEILISLDELEVVAKQLLGEVSFRGYTALLSRDEPDV